MGNPRTPEYYKHNWSYKGMKEALETIPDNRERAFCCTLYAFAARITEIVGAMDINQLGLRKQDLIVIQLQDKQILEATLWNEKQKNINAVKKVSINMNREPWLAQPILDWKQQCETERLFPFSRVYGFKIVKRIFEFHPHYFRKSRTTHFLNGQVTGKPESPEMVRMLFAWSSAEVMLHSYSQVSMQDALSII